MKKAIISQTPRLRLGFLINLITLIGLIGGLSILSFYYFLNRSKPVESSLAASATPVVVSHRVTALGRLEPQGKVIALAASPAGGTRIAQLLVEEGDKVQVGQVVAILDGYDTLVATLEQAKRQVKVAQSQLAQVKAGAKTGSIEAQRQKVASLEVNLQGQITTQKAKIERLKAEFSNAKYEFQRYENLHQEGAVSTSLLDNKRLTMDTFNWQIQEEKSSLEQMVNTSKKQIQEASSTLAQIREVRPVDVAVAQAHVESAITALKKAESDLKLSYVRSPINGQVLKLNTRQGEAINSVTNGGIIKLAYTDQMNVVAEVYETDIHQVHPGQKATITSDAFPGKLTGTVIFSGLEIGKQDILNADPAADVDARVSEVKIRLDPKDSQQVRSLTNLQVEVSINL
ncbi:ABC exporter membrane fusion protein [Dolichospermum circinale]|uniref:ABC exporter membrane fusion protein n=1 Tax=Dolichospermum circinale TaxID=109265 RepID=UPI0023302E6B|nr:ABC exporter membrane fusion protein [Dolichospermum circinale]MDB9450042.1 ABC exporter membrane fusion protein [Dolichospermum circinale CS-547]